MVATLVAVNLPAQTGHGRSQGVHLSKIIRAIATESGILDPKWAEDISLEEVSGKQEGWWNSLDPSVRLKMSIGLAWEDWYVPMLGTVAYHPGEMEIEGVFMTHDGESVDVLWNQGNLACHEVKATYKSTKTVANLESQWMWLAQLKGYCKGLGVTVAYMHVLFLCGDYKYPISPQLRCWKVRFTQEEIDENWDLMTGYVQHRRNLEREDDQGLEGGV